MINKIILALDTTDAHQALEITKKIKDKIFTVKLGLEFFNANGKNGIQKFNNIGVNNLMLDLKLNDIPETVYKAIKALEGIKLGFLTIHAQGGKAMIEKAKEAASKIRSQPKILMVTILTSLNDNDLKIMGNYIGILQQVEHFAKIAKEMGVGIVCSGHEAKAVRKIIGSELQIFTPGVRMPNDSSNDQQRVCTPLESIKNGSDKIIMGRSLIKGNVIENINRVSKSLEI